MNPPLVLAVFARIVFEVRVIERGWVNVLSI
jgi:uncharacterized protein YsxB (DUF464 family)